MLQYNFLYHKYSITAVEYVTSSIIFYYIIRCTMFHSQCFHTPANKLEVTKHIRDKKPYYNEQREE